MWEVKSMSRIVMSSYERKLFLYLCKLEWFKSKQILIDENVCICSQDPFRAVNSDRDLASFRTLRLPKNAGLNYGKVVLLI
jgi:hypothetical protein